MIEMINIISMYSLSALIVALGGVSLFLQKIYRVSSKSGEKIGEKEEEETVIELPFFGKLRTNYPALGFMFIGAALAYFTFDRSCQLKDNWTIIGELDAPENHDIDWNCGSITLYPQDLTTNLEPAGSFSITGPLQKGKKFEDAVKQISYSNGCGESYYKATIMPKEEYIKYNNKNPDSIVLTAEPGMRKYKPVSIEVVKIK